MSTRYSWCKLSDIEIKKLKDNALKLGYERMARQLHVSEITLKNLVGGGCVRDSVMMRIKQSMDQNL